MTAHLESLIAKAKAATQGPLTVIRYEHGGGRIYKEEPRTLVADLFQENDREFIASCNPHLILALCELAMAAEEVDRLDLMHDSEILVDKAKRNLRLALAPLITAHDDEGKRE